ncbi:MAG: hypothetical protein ACRC2N_01490 [Aeromonas sp.]
MEKLERKTQMRMFCHNYTDHTNSLIKNTIQKLAKDIEQIENNKELDSELNMEELSKAD